MTKRVIFRKAPVAPFLAATPTFSPPAGNYIGSQSIAIACATPGALIYYTLDGTTPTTSSTQFLANILISKDSIVQALAVASGFDPSAIGSAAYQIGTAPVLTGSIKFNPGHYMQSRSLDQSGPGAQNFLDIGLLTTTNTQRVAAGLPPFQGQNFVYSWAYVETTQGVYNFSQTIDKDVVHAFATNPGCRIGIWFRSFGNQGTNAIVQAGSSSNTTFSGSNAALVPPYIFQATSGGHAGWLQSTDTTMYTKSAPRSPNTGEFLWSMSQWSGSGYDYFVGGNWWHPVASQCFANMKQALASHIVPDGLGFTYDNHPNIEMGAGSWDEESVNFGWGGTWNNRPPDDPGVMVGASGAFTGGTAFHSADGTAIASCTALQINAAIEQNLIGSKSAPPASFTASDPGASPSTWTVNKGFSHTSVGSCLSFNMSGNIVGSGNGFVTQAQLRQHMLNLKNGLVEFGNADLLGAEYSQDAAGVAWNFGNIVVTPLGSWSNATSGTLSSSWTGSTAQRWTVLNGIGRAINYINGSTAMTWAGPVSLPSPISGSAFITHNHSSNGIFVGGVYADENNEQPGAYIPPFGGVATSLATPNTPIVTGTLFWTQMQKNGYIEGLDYGDAVGAGQTNYTAGAVTAIGRTGAFDRTCRFWWQNCSNRFQPFPDEWNGTNPSFPAFILAGVNAIPAFNAQQTLLVLPYMIGPPVTSVTVNSSSSLTVNWAALTNVGPVNLAAGMSVKVLRNGVVIATKQIGTSFVDTGLITQTTYVYTLEMSNQNGTSSPGTGMSGTTL